MYETLLLHFTTSSGCFCPRTIYAKNRIGQFTTDLLYIRFTYYNKDNEQEWSMLSNWFSLRIWGRGTTCLLYDGSRVGLFFVSSCVSLVWWREIFLLMSLIHVLYITQLCLLFSSQMPLLSNSLDLVATLSNMVDVRFSRLDIGWSKSEGHLIFCYDVNSHKQLCKHTLVMSIRAGWPSWDGISTHWGRDKMDAILQTIFSNAFFIIKMLKFRLKFHSRVFLRVLITIF